MLRRILCLLLCFLLAAPMAQAAGFDTMPSREVFSMAYDRLQKAIARERPVSWSVAVSPVAIDGYVEGALETMSAIVSGLELSGSMQCLPEGGRIEATVVSDRREIISIGQITEEDRKGIKLDGEWLSIARNMETEAAALLDLDGFGLSLLRMDYATIRDGDVPFLTAIYDQGIALWGLASPYSQDTNRVSVPSGQTGHGVTYEIDTQGLRSMLGKWADQLSNEGLCLGLAGSDLSISISDETFDAFVAKIRDFASHVEVSKPLKFTTTFGEGDLLRTAKGSGTIAENGKRSGISYAYSCSPSSTRMTRKYKIDFQPAGRDTLVLNGTLLTSSNNKSSGANEIDITASGVYEGEPYKLKLSSNLVNKFSMDDSGILTEVITGTVTVSLKYAGQTVLDATIKRDGVATSSAGLEPAIDIEDRYDVVVTNDEGSLFEGVITIALGVDDASKDLPDVLADAQRLEDMDFMAVELLRDSLQNGLAGAKQKLLQTLPLSSAITALLTMN